MLEMERGENVEFVMVPVKHRLIEIYEAAEGGRTLIYVGRTAKTLEKYVEDIKTFEKVEKITKTAVQQYMYGKGIEKFEFETDGVEYETMREAEAAKAAVIKRDKPTMDSTMIYNRKIEVKAKEKTETTTETKKKFVYAHGRMLVFNVDPVKEAQKAIKRGEKARKFLEEYEKHGGSVKKKDCDTTISWE